MVYYKPLKITIDIFDLARVIIDVLIWYYRLFASIITNKGSVLILKFWLLLYYFFVLRKAFSPLFNYK